MFYLGPMHNGRYFVDGIFKLIFLYENSSIFIQISLKFVTIGPMNIMRILVRIMARHRSGDKQLFEPWVIQVTDAYMRHSASEG